MTCEARRPSRLPDVYAHRQVLPRCGFDARLGENGRDELEHDCNLLGRGEAENLETLLATASSLISLLSSRPAIFFFLLVRVLVDVHSTVATVQETQCSIACSPPSLPRRLLAAGPPPHTRLLGRQNTPW